MYITLVHFNKSTVFYKGKLLKLVKDEYNHYDDESISVLIYDGSRVANVANSVHSVIRGCMSAGRVYDKLTGEDYAQVKFYNKNFVIAKILTSDEVKHLKKDSKSKIHKFNKSN